MLRHLTLGLLVTVTLVGCGASTHTVTEGALTPAAATPKAPPTKPRFIARADAVCRSLKSQQAPLEAKLGKLEGKLDTSSEAAAGALLRQDVTFARAADAKLAAIPRPPADAATIEKLLGGYADEATDLSNFADAYGSADVAAREAVAATLKKTVAFDRGIARRYGMKVCSEG